MLISPAPLHQAYAERPVALELGGYRLNAHRMGSIGGAWLYATLILPADAMRELISPFLMAGRRIILYRTVDARALSGLPARRWIQGHPPGEGEIRITFPPKG